MDYDSQLCYMCYETMMSTYFQCCVCKIESKICDGCCNIMLRYGNRCSDWCRLYYTFGHKYTLRNAHIELFANNNTAYCLSIRKHQSSILSTFTHVVEKKKNFTKAYLLQFFIKDLVNIIIEYQ